jgi:predicted RNase H-like HicB family nuclease
MVTKHAFTLESSQDDGWYVSRLKEVPGIFSQGADLQELEANIEDAYRMLLEGESEEARPKAADQADPPRRGVKRAAFIRELIAAGCCLKHYGGRHDIYANPANRSSTPAGRPCWTPPLAPSA